MVDRTLGRLVLLGALVFAFWLASAIVASAVGAFSDFGDALWSGVRHLLDPGSLGDDETTAQRLIGVAQVLLGIVLVVGLVLTLLSDVVDRMLQRLGESDPPARASGHLLVIGTGDALVPILSRLERHEPGSEAVVLVPPGDSGARRELQSRLDAALPRLRVRAISGEATGAAGLARGAASQARAIAVLSEPIADDDAADVRAIEVATTIAETLSSSPGGLPHVGVEMRRGRNVDAVWSRFPAEVDAVVRDRSLGAVLAIAIRNPAFAAILGTVSARDREGGLFAVPAGELAGRPFADALAHLDVGAPVGVVRDGEIGQIVYAPSPQLSLGARDLLIVSSESEPRADGRVNSPPPPPPQREATATEPLPPAQVLVIGWSDAVESMLDALAEVPGQTPPLTVLAADDPRPGRFGGLAWRQGDPRSPADLGSALEQLDPEVILVTAGAGGDAAAMISALHLCRLLGEREVPLLVEQRARPSPLAERDRRIHVVSAPALAGETIALAALDPITLALQEALVAHPIEQLRVTATAAGGTSFADLHAALLAEGAAAIGLARDGRALDAEAETPVQAGDAVLVVRAASRASRS